MSPRYDVPKAAPEPLRQIQLFLNTVDLHNEVEWLPDWLRSHGSSGAAEARASTLREALRSLVLANNGFSVDAAAVEVFNRAAARLSLGLDEAGGVQFLGARDVLDDVLVIALRAMLDGSWSRLKACRNCRWSFYDYSPNRSATWCSMQLCGNRTKTRAYRSRLRTRDP
jgi:predicted RNA-binding Zn ribbon-like protein